MKHYMLFTLLGVPLCCSAMDRPTELYKAIEESDLDSVQRLCADPQVAINYCGTEKMPEQCPLIKAVSYYTSSPAIIRALLYTPGIDVNKVCQNGHSAFANICRHPQADEVLSLFLEADEEEVLQPRLDRFGPWEGNRNILDYALEISDWSFLYRISSIPGIAINTRRNDGLRSHFLHKLAEGDMTPSYTPELLSDLFFTLVERGMHISPQDEEEQTPYHRMAAGQRIADQVIPLVILFGDPGFPALLEAVSPVSKLHTYAALGEVKKMKRYLAEYPECDINERTYQNWHVLHLAAYNDHPQMVRYLYSLPGIDLSSRTAANNTPYASGLIGAHARKMVKRYRGGFKSFRVFDEFCKGRFAVLISLEKAPHIKKLPVELLERLVNSYRLSEVSTC